MTSFPVSAIKDAEKILQGVCEEYDITGCKINSSHAITKAKLVDLEKLGFANYTIRQHDDHFNIVLIWDLKK